MTSPFVSVVMPAYNHERFVAEAIESVLRQTSGDLELIIVNDGSTDRTGEIAQSFTDPRIRYFEQANAGAHAAINFGLGESRGRIQAILNSDDVYAPKRLEFLTEHTAVHSLFLAFTDLRYIDAHGRPLDESMKTWRAPIEALYRKTHTMRSAVLRGNLAVTTSNFFMSAEAAIRIGSMRDRRYAHDYDYLLRAVATPGVQCLYFPEASLLDYRFHGNNTISENAAQCLTEVVATLAEHAPRLTETPRDAELMTAALQQIHDLSGHLPAIQAELRGIKGSRSWKLTEPLRRGQAGARVLQRLAERLLRRSRRGG